MIVINKTFNGKKIKSKKGEAIKVQLEENPTTGYIWKIQSLDDKHIHFKEDKFEAEGDGVGAGGIKTFYFEINNEGVSDLHIVLSNSWENDPADTFNVTIES
ncbi:protease inhibitor I42 family protein [Flavobacterium sp.]|uniref:protease inhibitor I42 family protein n=1 Tax=Flavobacterium sp. TaxID=239 RepID=UPI002B53E506|nr:protease inhibitor I42 family protein [Flavobacterium sp.]HSD06777.1 protease inhibitor I42 family protein [Flavobacterium sp.]